jgi:hypothetical protein
MSYGKTAICRKCDGSGMVIAWASGLMQTSEDCPECNGGKIVLSRELLTQKERIPLALADAFRVGWDLYCDGVREQNLPTGRQIADKLLDDCRASIHYSLRVSCSAGYRYARAEVEEREKNISDHRD